MKRRIISLLLCALMLLGVAAGCAKKSTPKESFFEIADSLKEVKDANFTASMSMKLPAEAMSDPAVTGIFGDISDLKLDLSGSFSQTNKQFATEISATFSGTQGDSTIKLTDMLYDESGMYINFHTIFDLIMSMQGNTVDYSSIFTSDYLGVTFEELAALSGQTALNGESFGYNMEDYPKYSALCTRLYGVIKDALKAESFTADGSTYTLTLNMTGLVDLVKVFASDMDANAGEYADVLIEYDANIPGYLDTMGIQVEGRSRDELITTIKAKAAEISSELESEVTEDAPDFSMTISLGKGSAAKSYTFGLSMTAPEEEFDAKADLTITGGAIEKITPPTDHLTLDDIMALFMM